MPPFQTLDHHTDEALEKENYNTLNEKTWADLIALCQERGLPAEGDKAILIKQLLDWKSNTRPVPAPSTPRLFSSEDQNSNRQNNINSVYISSLLIKGDGDDGIESINYDELVIGRKLGSGGFKDCYAGKLKGSPVAIGELRVSNFSETDFKEMKHEINVLKFIGVCINSKHLCIITELCENGDLYDYMRKFPKPTFTQQINFMHDIAFGVAYLHSRRPSIIHRVNDLRAKINDFGLARIRPRANASMHTQCGTPNWQAPEFWTPNPSYTEKVDVYASALIFWEIMTWAELGYPYQGYTEHQLYESVRDKGVRPQTDTLKNYPQALIGLVEEMWQSDPKKRPNMNYVVENIVKFLA
ncbi:14506_t:CDS:10 [Entrophospora sp. SA101]|nr:14506_t:CDS:10 [Entrophospora sp. SA101]CAJ0847503.1 10749_t:CDS:10 [Entrophospora sp. SA101]CAJ0897002.1 10966_t:CDS:10 [Entrophospora sp. SA101]